MGCVSVCAGGSQRCQHDLAQLRSLQDWFIKFETATVPGVSKSPRSAAWCASIRSRSTRQRLRAYDLTLPAIKTAIRNANQETGGSVLELGEVNGGAARLLSG
ncbi:MAG: hypothetical protein R3E95_13740 [Thiolinea sp.]